MKVKEFIKYVFVFEKSRYYSGGALRHPIRITQKFWDEMQERKRYYKEQQESGFRYADTNYGSATADLGNRPIVPDWVVNLRNKIFYTQGIIGWMLIIGYILSQVLK